MADELYNVQYAQEAVEDLRKLRAFDQRKILEAVEQHLRSNPTQVSRPRIKLMRRPFWSQYRLRVDDFRVYYDIDEAQHTVNVLRVLEKAQGETPRSPPHETD